MKWILDYQRGKWECTAKGLGALLPDTRDRDIVDAMEAFHRRYYPDESERLPQYPWMMHADTDRLEELKSSVEKFELTWHSLLLLPCLRDFKVSAPGHHSIVLCISQIRQWQLLSCFQMEWPPAGSTNLVRNIRDAPKRLLRPPVFGKSHRITRGEVYAAFYDSRVLIQIREAVKSAGKDSFRLAHVLGRHDSYFKVSNVVESKGSYELDVEHVIDVEPEQAPLSLENHETDDVCRPYGVAPLPFFQESSDKNLPKPEDFLFSSDNYCRAFEQLSDVLNDPSARSVLVIAPPGSGKESLSSILHKCRRHRGRYVITSLAGLDEKAVAFQLFHLNTQTIKHRVEETSEGARLKVDFQPELEDGAFFKAIGGTLAIDELDKASDAARSMLLRFLESGEVTIPDTSIVLTIPEQLRPLNVFAGSKARKEFLQLGPIDFWSRITHIVEMQHPLALGESADRLRTAEDYVRMFWLQRVKAYFNGEGLLKGSNDLYEPLRLQFGEWWKSFASRSVGEFIAREIAEVLCGPGQPLPSVRTLRVTVGRCFNLLFHALLYHKRSDAPLELWRASTASLKLEFEPAKRLKELLKKADGAQSHGNGLTVEEVGALNEIRSLIRASASIQV